MARQDQKRPTLKTIAEITGLSLSTVSLSLRDGSNLKQSTRDKVAKAAREIGYVPNRAGVRLRTGQTNVLALVLAAEQNTVDYTRLLLQGIGAHILGSKYHLNVIPEFQLTDPTSSVRYILENRSADGVIVTHTSARDPRVQMLMDADFPFVSHGRTEFYSPHPYHDFHAERFVQMAVHRLVEKGRRRFLLAAVNNGTVNYSNNVSGFHRAMAETAQSGDVVENAARLATADQARIFGQSLAERARPYDAIICNNELTAMAIISGLSDRGRVLGRDYDLICKQISDILPTLYPAMDTVAEDLFASGEALARQLIERVAGAEVARLQTLNEPEPRWRA